MVQNFEGSLTTVPALFKRSRSKSYPRVVWLVYGNRRGIEHRNYALTLTRHIFLHPFNRFLFGMLTVSIDISTIRDWSAPSLQNHGRMGIRAVDHLLHRMCRQNYLSSLCHLPIEIFFFATYKEGFIGSWLDIGWVYKRWNKERVMEFSHPPLLLPVHKNDF